MSMSGAKVKEQHKISDKIAWREIDGEIYIVVPSNSRLHSLNETASIIWKLLNRKKSEEEIAVALSEEYEVGRAAARTDVAETIKILKEEGVIL